MPPAMHRTLVALALACLAPGPRANAQTSPDSATRGPRVRVEYDERTDSTTRSLSAYAIVDTSATPPDTFALELSQGWKGRGTVAPVAAVEVGLGRTRAEGFLAGKSPLGNAPRGAAVVFLLDGTRRIRLERAEYVSNAPSAAGRITFETARYRMSAADLRLIAECAALRVRIGDRELWIDPAWRRVAAEMVAGQAPAGTPVRKTLPPAEPTPPPDYRSRMTTTDAIAPPPAR